jgi:hypothetical protein
LGGALSRLLASKKQVIATGGMISALILTWFGIDVTEGVGLVIEGFFGALLGGQIILDALHGSPSDGMVPDPAPPVEGDGGSA